MLFYVNIKLTNYLIWRCPILNPATFEQEYRICYCDIDCRKNALITSLMNYFEDVAMLQSEQLGIGLKYLKKHCKAWVLYKWDIKIHRFPTYNEKVKVGTIPYAFNRFYAYRHFYITSCEGEKLVSANSVWLFIDTDKKRPIKITEDMYKAYKVKFDKPERIKKIQKPSSIDIEKEFQVRYSDIDTNKHVNNVKYAEWAIETVPMDIVLNYTLSNLKVTYRKETTYGKTIKVLTQVLDESKNITCLHNIVDGNNKQLCFVESKWLQ